MPEHIFDLIEELVAGLEQWAIHQEPQQSCAVCELIEKARKELHHV